EVNIEKFADKASLHIGKLSEHPGRKIRLRVEPGKYIVSRSTSLIVKVTHIKEKSGNLFLGVDSGFNHLVRPAMYGAYHHVVNLSAVYRGETEKLPAKVAGYICETGDIFSELGISRPRKGDYLAILSAGAYGSSMSGYYNDEGDRGGTYAQR
ncbi:MAG TPA: diaminopimelate decarboxylase, partial [Candidatus Moranbacteria bacterium]|nr:diaminopimelate decarboxylase [Candidatus Moranbacteria bacterium]